MRNPVSNVSNLQQLLIPGLATKQMITVLGKPLWKTGSHEYEVWGYKLSEVVGNADLDDKSVTGVSLTITNGRLMAW